MSAQKNTMKAKPATQFNSIFTSAKPDSSLTKGFRLGILKPFYSTSVEIGLGNDEDVFFQDTEDPGVDYSNGLKFGYAYLPVKTLGYIADFDFLEISMSDKSANLVRLAGNVAYAFTSQFNVHAGFNRTDLVSKGASKWDAGSGTQIGVGYQFTRHMGIEFNYSAMQISSVLPLDFPGTSANAEFDLNLRGYDLNFVGTF